MLLILLANLEAIITITQQVVVIIMIASIARQPFVIQARMTDAQAGITIGANKDSRFHFILR